MSDDRTEAPGHTLLILGASVRAAAASALRAGLRPIAADRFADFDLKRIAPTVRVHSEADFDAAVRAAPPGPWLYTGALENRPELVDRIAAVRPLWGVAGAALRRARDPVAFAEALRSVGLPALEARDDAAGLPSDGSWLVKPRRSAAGIGVRTFQGRNDSEPTDVYYQRRVRGPSGSAVYVGAPGGVQLIGVTRQWVGRPGRPFGYVGSLGPLRVPEGFRQSLEHIGARLGDESGLRGLFGVDFVAADGLPWPTEINPRYTASVEILERATGRALLNEVAAAFGSEAQPGRTAEVPGGVVVGKRVVYAPADGRVPRGIRWPVEDPLEPRIADLPEPGTPFRAGGPVLTLLERAASPRACRARLVRRHAAWLRRLTNWAEPSER